MGITGDFAALAKMQAELELVADEGAESCAEAVGVMLVEEIHRASIQVVGPNIEIHRYLPRPAYLVPRLADKAEQIIDDHLMSMVEQPR
jgi:hypothetical protein